MTYYNTACGITDGYRPAMYGGLGYNRGPKMRTVGKFDPRRQHDSHVQRFLTEARKNNFLAEVERIQNDMLRRPSVTEIAATCTPKGA